MTTLSQTLYDFAEVMNSIEENNGVIDDSLLPVLVEKEGLVAEKVDSYVQFIESVQGQIEKQKQLLKDLHSRTKILEVLEDSLKKNAKNLMECYSMNEIRGHQRKIKLNNNGGKLSIEYPEDFHIIKKVINKEYLRYLTSDMYVKEEIYILNNDKVREHLESEQTLECVRILPRGKYIKLN